MSHFMNISWLKNDMSPPKQAHFIKKRKKKKREQTLDKMNIPWTQYHSFGLECRIHASIIINGFSYIFVRVHSINLSPKSWILCPSSYSYAIWLWTCSCSTWQMHLVIISIQKLYIKEFEGWKMRLAFSYI